MAKKKTIKSKRSATRRSLQDVVRPQRMTIDELEAILQEDDEREITILPNGEVIASKGNGPSKPLTMRENLGGEYALVA